MLDMRCDAISPCHPRLQRAPGSPAPTTPGHPRPRACGDGRHARLPTGSRCPAPARAVRAGLTAWHGAELSVEPHGSDPCAWCRGKAGREAAEWDRGFCIPSTQGAAVEEPGVVPQFTPFHPFSLPQKHLEGKDSPAAGSLFASVAHTSKETHPKGRGRLSVPMKSPSPNTNRAFWLANLPQAPVPSTPLPWLPSLLASCMPSAACWLTHGSQNNKATKKSRETNVIFCSN